MDFLEQVCELESQRRDEALDLIFSTIDDMHIDGKFAEVDKILQIIDVERFSITILLGFLTITSSARKHLKERAGLCRRVRAELTKRNTENIEELLNGLEKGPND